MNRGFPYQRANHQYHLPLLFRLNTYTVHVLHGTQYKDDFPGVHNTIIWVRRSLERLLFIMGIPIAERRCFILKPFKQSFSLFFNLIKNKLRWKFNPSTNIFIQVMVFECVLFKIAAILSGSHSQLKNHKWQGRQVILKMIGICDQVPGKTTCEQDDLDAVGLLVRN